MAFLHGLAVEELSADEINYWNADYELTIGVKGVK
jgi:hypothetical protein